MNVYDGRWQKARLTYLAEHPLCSMCMQQGKVVKATEVDHIVRHGLKAALASGDRSQIQAAQDIFWDSSNWQALCKPHHDSTKQRQEKTGREAGAQANGMPLDPNHLWNRS